LKNSKKRQESPLKDEDKITSCPCSLVLSASVHSAKEFLAPTAGDRVPAFLQAPGRSGQKCEKAILCFRRVQIMELWYRSTASILPGFLPSHRHVSAVPIVNKKGWRRPDYRFAAIPKIFRIRVSRALSNIWQPAPAALCAPLYIEAARKKHLRRLSENSNFFQNQGLLKKLPQTYS